MSSVFYIVIPIVVVVLILKLCLIFWRVWLYSKRRQQRAYVVRQQQAARPTARVISVRRVTCPEGIAQQTCYAISQPGCAPRTVTRTVLVRNTDGRPMDPNLPPTYDQAVTGTDRSVKIDEGQPPSMLPTAPPPPPGVPPPAMFPPGAPPPFMPPPGAPPPSMPPDSASAPPPPPYVQDPGELEDSVEGEESSRLLP